MAPRREWRALPLVSRVRNDAGEKLEVQDDARDALLQYGAPRVGVLGLLGPPATGKRLLLRTLLNATSVDFSAASGTHSDVQLWLWLPVDAHATESCARIVLSSGGFSKDEKDDMAQPDKQQLALLLLLSSTLAYNAEGEINAQAVEHLTWLSHVAQLLRVKTSQDAEAVASDFPHHAPTFVWLARQFKLKWLRSTDGEKLSPSAYLSQALQEEAGYSQAVMKRNTLRMYLETYFPVRHCVALGRELEGNATGNASPSTDPQTLRSQFLETLDQFYDSYLSDKAGNSSQLPVKQLLGQDVSTKQFVDVLDTYVTAMNGGELPTMQVAALGLAQKAIGETFQQAESVYKEQVQLKSEGDAANSAAEVRELQVAHLRGLQMAMARVREVACSLPDAGSLKTLFRESLTRWEAQVKREFQTALEQNVALSREACGELLTSILPHNLELMAAELEAAPRETFADGLVQLLTQYKADLTTTLATYAQQSRGPARAVCLERALLESVLGSVQQWGLEVLRQYHERLSRWTVEHQQLERRLAQVETQYAEISTAAAEANRLGETRLDQQTQQLSELRRTLRSELNGSNAELARLTQELATTELKHELRVKQRESDLAWARSRTTELESAVRAERQRKEELASAASEMLDKERRFHREERSLLAQQKDAMTQVVQLERQLASKKTAHAQKIFAVENAHAKALDALRAEQAQFARQLKAQAKRDVDVLRHGHETRKQEVQQERQQLEEQIAEVQQRLEDMASAEQAEQAAAAGRRDFFRSFSVPLPLTTTPPPAAAAAGEEQTAQRAPETQASKTASSALVRSGSVDVNATATTHVAAQQSSADMCRQS